MTQNRNGKKIKVCIVTISLSKGGAERSTALLSRMLSAENFDVFLVTLNDVIDYRYSGELINLGKNKHKEDPITSRLYRFIEFRKRIKKENFDFIIDNRNRQFALKELFYLKYIYRGNKIIYVVRSFKLSQYFPENKFVRKWMIKKSKGIVGVSKAIAQSINKQYLQAAQSMGASQWDIFRRVVLPATLPSIVVGSAVGMGITWEVVVAAEMISGGGGSGGAGGGLGFFIWNSYVGGSYEQIVVGMISIGIAGYFSSEMLRNLGGFLTPWLKTR